MNRRSSGLIARPSSFRLSRSWSSEAVLNHSRISTSFGGVTLGFRVTGISIDASRESTALIVYDFMALICSGERSPERMMILAVATIGLVSWVRIWTH